jgi:hypothetical protein
MCAQVREEVAVALLTGTDLPSQARDHLVECEVCAADAAELSVLPDLLSVTRPDVLDEDPQPDEAGLRRLLAAAAAARRSRHRRSIGLAVAAAAAVVLIAAGGVFGWLIHSSSDATPVAGSQVVHATAGPSVDGVAAGVTLAPTAWGSDLTMSISGVAPGTKCTLVVVTKDGDSVPAATWWATYAGTAQVHATVAVGVDAIARIDVVNTHSKAALLQVPVA